MHLQDEHVHTFPSQRLVSSLSDAPAEVAHCFMLAEIEEATKHFEKKIGSGGFGVVYYGRMKDGKEIAVKVLTNDSYQGKREFSNEVSSPETWGIFQHFSQYGSFLTAFLVLQCIICMIMLVTSL